MSCVICHVSHVICQVTVLVLFDKMMELDKGGSVINRAYPVKFFFFICEKSYSKSENYFHIHHTCKTCEFLLVNHIGFVCFRILNKYIFSSSSP